jgi:hypothetical protein
LTSASTTFTWSAGSAGATGYYLNIGTSPGAANLVNIGPLSGTSTTVNLPTNGATIYVRLWTVLNGTTWLYNDYIYTEFTQSAAVMASPTPGTLTSASTTFTWNAGSAGTTGYYLNVGTSPGGANLVNIGPLSGTSTTVNLPTNGATIYVRLSTVFNGTTELSNDYTFTEFTQSGAAITSPTPSSTLTSASTTFTWSAGSAGTTGYYLNVGTSPGGANLVNIGPLSGTSATVNLSTNGATIYVRLWTVLNGTTWLYNDYTYSAASSSPTLSGLNCANASMTAAGTDNCTVTLNAPAATGGFAVSLASNNSAVAVPASVTVAAGATTAGFTATVSSVSTAQTVTLTASANSVAKTFALQLGTSVPVLSALTCVSGSMTGAGTDSCSVTLNAASPSGGFAVSLASNNSAVAVPASITVAAGATTASFTATVSSVSTAQTVTLTASAGGVAKTFVLQLGTAAATLSVNATTIAFGNVNLNSPATQTLILTSTGSAAVTVSAATVSGTGFTISGGPFPVTLNPNQTATVSVQFDPTTAVAFTGQVTITSNSSKGSSAVVTVSGTGAAVSYHVSLSWSAPASSPDPVAGYNVYRSPSGASSYQQLNTTVVTQTTYVDTGVQNSQTYDYIVESVDASGVSSSPSNMAAVPIS